MEQSVNTMILKGIKALEQGNTLVALMEFEEAAKVDSSPTVMAYHGHCIALERQEYRKGITLCRQAAEKDPNNSTIWLVFGRTCLAVGNKPAAIKAFRRGLKAGRNPEITRELKQLGHRKPLLFSTLERSHPLNRYLGLAFNRLGLR